MARQRQAFLVNTIVIFQQRFYVRMMNVFPHQTYMAVVDLGEEPLIRHFCLKRSVPCSLLSKKRPIFTHPPPPLFVSLFGAPLKGNCSFIKKRSVYLLTIQIMHASILLLYKPLVKISENSVSISFYFCMSPLYFCINS